MSDTLTIKEAKDMIRPLLKKGTTCPCCSQRVQLYTRSLTWSMVYALIIFANEDQPEDGFIHAEEVFKKNANAPQAIRGDFPKLRFWGFIEPKETGKEDGNPCSGYYRITQKGLDFITCKILVNKSVKLYNNKFYGFDGPEIDCYVAAKGKFDYNKLMHGGGL